MLEIELKIALTKQQYKKIKNYFDDKFQYSGSVIESDVYFNGIDRDFSKTDETFRLRKVERETNTSVFVTYKGAKLNKAIKARKELEVSVSDYGTMLGVISSLGFKEAAHVKKQRYYYTDGSITATLDDVNGLGEFLELEILAPDQDDVDKYSAQLFDLLSTLKLDRKAVTTSSYLEMLLKKQR